MALVLLPQEPRSLQSFLLPVLMADRHLMNAQGVLNDLYVIEGFLSDVGPPRALHTMSMSIRHLERTIVALELYKLEKMAALQTALNQFHHRYGHVPMVTGGLRLVNVLA